MKNAKVKIKGTSPMLVHKFNMEKSEKKKDKVYVPEEDAAKALYKDEKIGCYVPSTWIESALREAGKNFPKQKSNYKNTIQSSVMVEEDKIPLNKDTWDEIDMRPVVIQRQRIVRSRPKFNNWELTFNVKFDDARITGDMLKDILVEAGSCKGIGDYRPKHGRFSVEKFEVK